MLPILLFSLFALVGAFYLVHTMGWKITDRMTVQQAADRGAYSAAAINARSLNMIEYLNSAMVASRAIESIYDGIEEMYPAIMSEACGICAVTGSPYYCALCSRMQSKQGQITATIQQGRAKVTMLVQSIGALGQAVVTGTPKWASAVAERIAKANGASEAWAHPRAADRLPFSDGKADELRQRTNAIASRYYQQDVKVKDTLIFAGWPEPQYTGAITAKANAVSGPYWVPDYNDRAGQRKALVQTVFTAVPAEDDQRLGRMAAAGVKDTQSAFGKNPEVAVARAEPYFTLNGGTPDGRPGWSARLRPVHTDAESRQSLQKAANQVGFLGIWKKSLGAGLAQARIPH